MKQAWLALASGLLIATNAPEAYGAMVRAVSPAKALVAVDLEEGETPKKGDSVCFYTSSLKKIDCGKALKLKGQVLIVQMRSKAVLSKLKKSMPAKITPASGELDDPDSEAASGFGATVSNDKEPSTKSSSKYTATRLWLVYAPALSTPSVYNLISFLGPDRKTPPATLWTPGKASGPALIGFGMQIGFPVGKKAMLLGLRYRKIAPSAIDTDYTAGGSPNPFAATSVSASAIGLWGLYQVYRSPWSQSIVFNLNAGLDVDQSTVVVTATKKNDNAPDSGKIVDATSKLVLISPKFGPSIDFYLAKSFGLTFGVNATIPLLAMTNSLSAKFADGEDAGLTTANDDLKKSLGHKKNTVALDFAVSTFLVF